MLPDQPDGPFVETLRTQSTESPYVKVYGRGFVLVSPGTLWRAAKQGPANVAACSTDEQQITENTELQYEYSFLVHYTVHNVLTVEWDDAFRFGTIEGTPEAPQLAIVKHQKTQGSDFITLSEGTIEILPTTDPNVSELSFVEHLDATSAGAGDVIKGVQHNYDALVAVAHGLPIPHCP
jgi:hypothetical protein